MKTRPTAYQVTRAVDSTLISRRDAPPVPRSPLSLSARGDRIGITRTKTQVAHRCLAPFVPDKCQRSEPLLLPAKPILEASARPPPSPSSAKSIRALVSSDAPMTSRKACRISLVVIIPTKRPLFDHRANHQSSACSKSWAAASTVVAGVTRERAS